LALFDRTSNTTKIPDGCIEAKWWGAGNQRVLEDLNKMRGALPGHVRKFGLLLGQAQDAAFETARHWASGLPLTFRPDWQITFNLQRDKNVIDGPHWPFFYITVAELV